MNNFNKHDIKVIAILLILIAGLSFSGSLQDSNKKPLSKTETTSFNFWGKL